MCRHCLAHVLFPVLCSVELILQIGSVLLLLLEELALFIQLLSETGDLASLLVVVSSLKVRSRSGVVTLTEVCFFLKLRHSLLDEDSHLLTLLLAQFQCIVHSSGLLIALQLCLL